MEFRKALASALMIIAVSSSAWAQAPTTPEEKATWLKANGAFDTGNFLLKSKKYKEAVARYK
jgi:hypothetical protein